MAFVSEVIARLRLDTTDFQRGLTQSAADAAKVGDSIGKKLHRTFGAGHVFKSLLMGAGIGSVHSIIDGLTELLSGVTDAAKESYKEIGELSDKNTEDTVENMRKLASEETQYQLLLKQRARLLDKPSEGFRERQSGFFENLFKGLSSNPVTGTLLSGMFGGAATTLETNRAGENSAGKLAEAEKSKGQAIKADNELKEIDKKREERRKKDAEEYGRKLKELNQLQEDNALSQSSTEEKITELRKQQMDLMDKVRSGDGGADELIEREKIEKHITELKKQQVQEARRLKHAEDEMTEKLQNYATTLRDRSGFTVADAAGGKAGNATERVRARRVLSLEARAQRVRRMGSLIGPDGKSISGGAFADQLVNQADALRQQIPGLTDKESNPMKDAAKDIEKSREALEEIRDSLTAASIDG